MYSAPGELVSTRTLGYMLYFLRTSLLIVMVLAAKTTAASLERPGSRKSSVFSLFNLKSKSKFWSESVIRTDFDDLEGSVPSGHGKMEVTNYTKAGNIANFLKMSEVDSIYLPVPINFIFIGFEGKGNHEFKLGLDEMSRWFTKIDHIFEHTRVPPIGEILTPFFKTIVEKSHHHHHHLPLVSHVTYNFSVHAIQMGEKVTSVFEQAVEALSRKEDIFDSRRPIKAALAATAQHVTGLLPLYLGYSHAHQTAVEDWVWSVGCNPISTTSQGWQLSQFQTDAIARNYIITALEESIQDVNTAIHRLVLEQTTTQGFRLFKSQERAMVDKYNSVVSSWKRIAAISSSLRYGDVMRLLNLLEDSSKGFVDHVNATIASLHPVHCTRRRKVNIELDFTTIPAFLVVFVILWFVFRPRRPKPKIN